MLGTPMAMEPPKLETTPSVSVASRSQAALRDRDDRAMFINEATEAKLLQQRW